MADEDKTEENAKAAAMAAEAEVELDDDAPASGSGQNGEGFASVGEALKLRAELEQVKAQLREKQNDVLRTAADFDNYRKRIARDSVRDRELAEEKVIKKVLPVLDNLERGMQHMTATANIQAIKEGTDATLRQFLGALQELGVTQMDALEKPFDPKIHDAISQVVVPDKPEGTIVAVAEPGYMVKDRVLRHAKVVVSKAS